jgi:hypothetical protein
MPAQILSLRAATAVLVLLALLGTEQAVAPLGADAAESTSRIRFAPGSSSATLKGGVVRGDRDVYVLEARAGQVMTVSIASRENNAVFQIVGPNGAELPRAREGDDAMKWSGKLPRAGDYRIVVGGTRGNASYTLRVGIR